MLVRKNAAAALLLGTVFASSAFYSAPAHATVIGRETDAGFVGPLLGPTDTHPYTVASDGESGFDPFGAGFDTGDGIKLDPGLAWVQAADSNWTDIGNNTWVLPADLTAFGCGTENEPTCEPVGHWFVPNASWNAFSGSWEILDSAGGISDVIITSDISGGADLKFYSDPSLPVPEPMTLSLFGAGLAGLGAMRRRKARKST